jgi:hypothetical protein
MKTDPSKMDYYARLQHMKNSAAEEALLQQGINPAGKKLPDISGLIEKPVAKIKVRVGNKG